jgi:hypothetical protein
VKEEDDNAVISCEMDTVKWTSEGNWLEKHERKARR